MLHSYLHAQADGDGATACGLLSPAAQSQLRHLVGKNSNGLVPTPRSCADAVGLVGLVAGQKLLSALDAAQVEQVTVTGSHATAEMVDGGQFSPQRVALEKVAGEWKIVGVPSLG